MTTFQKDVTITLSFFYVLALSENMDCFPIPTNDCKNALVYPMTEPFEKRLYINPSENKKEKKRFVLGSQKKETHL